MAKTIPFPPNNNEQGEEAQTEASDSPVEDRHYSSDEVSAIIRLSLQQESASTTGSIDYEELLSIGKDMGVDAGKIDNAIKLLAEEQRTKAKEDELWLKFKAHCFISTSTIILCILLNFLTGIDFFWAGYPLLGLGFFMLGHYAGIRYAPEFVALATEHTMNLANANMASFSADDANVTFKISDDLGLSESSGMISVEDGHLLIEYQNYDSILGLWKSSIKEIEIPISEIRRARLEQKFWNSELVLQAKSMKSFSRLPGEVTGTFRITVNKESQNAAESLVKEINDLMK